MWEISLVNYFIVENWFPSRNIIFDFVISSFFSHLYALIEMSWNKRWANKECWIFIIHWLIIICGSKKIHLSSSTAALHYNLDFSLFWVFTSAYYYSPIKGKNPTFYVSSSYFSRHFNWHIQMSKSWKIYPTFKMVFLLR